MPGKYSHNVVLSDYSSQGLISIPNDKQINCLRDSATPRAASSASHRTRTHADATQKSPNTGSAGHAFASAYNQYTIHRSTHNPQRLLIIDSESDEEHPEPPENGRTSTAVRTAPTRQARADTPQHFGPEAVPKTPGRKTPRAGAQNTVPPSEDSPSIRSMRSSVSKPRSGGVKAFIESRYKEEAAADQIADPATSTISLHEFLDSAPRSPAKSKPQARAPRMVPDKTADLLHDRGISVGEFLKLVPDPASAEALEEPLKPSRSETQSKPGPTPGVSRLPKGLRHGNPTLPLKQTEAGPSKQPRRRPPMPAAKFGSTSTLTRGPPSRSASTTPTVIRIPPGSINSTMTMKNLRPSSPAPRMSVSQSRLAAPPQDQHLDGYELDFDGFTDDGDSYFTSIPVTRSSSKTVSRQTSLNRTWSVKSPVRRGNLPASPSAQTSTKTTSPQSTIKRSPKESLRAGGSNPPAGPSLDSPFDEAEVQPGTSGSWGLPTIQLSGEDGDSLKNMFDVSDGSGDQNILIFTSDEEGEEEDDLPTPRLQKLEEDVQFPSSEWGMISAGRHVSPIGKDTDAMSDLSAVYPPDIGRYTSGGEDDSPLAMALQNMRHGGEMGTSYKSSGRSLFRRRSINTTEILQKLGVRPTASSRSVSGASGGADTASSKSNPKSGQKYFPASSSRSRLPITP
ncbi:uncharacterized protein HMPREF1541_03269 [Cyphellophora europaea CBS 101466]|uniref:Uncharacterized protein n=1 Tax=Cyphellophora europaea (strain CBS 101466) TaxID=1220924 RepID=W2S062_CYPE1|nr:uncharacterized protein HMPREF1541_03269 [Cyphellophora europaea CBS 101466]ETN41334.1 hypothetical protein HMPREF1541_03269 [Cyphellophora europaea CBS 101466]